jgi:DinB superfamily
VTKPAPGSGWPALRDALAHINWAYVRWLADPFATTDEPAERATSWDELDAIRRRVRDHARGYLYSLDDDKLSTPREMNVDGRRLLYSPGEILVHVMLHERQHHGDLNTPCTSSASRSRSSSTVSRCRNGTSRARHYDLGRRNATFVGERILSARRAMLRLAPPCARVASLPQPRQTWISFLPHAEAA